MGVSGSGAIGSPSRSGAGGAVKSSFVLSNISGSRSPSSRSGLDGFKASEGPSKGKTLPAGTDGIFPFNNDESSFLGGPVLVFC